MCEAYVCICAHTFNTANTFSPFFLLPSSSFLQVSANEMVIQLPSHATAQFPALFSDLEGGGGGGGGVSGSMGRGEEGRSASLTDMGIASYGLSSTTLEDVFLRIANDDDNDDIPSSPSSPNGPNNGPNNGLNSALMAVAEGVKWFLRLIRPLPSSTASPYHR